MDRIPSEATPSGAFDRRAFMRAASALGLALYAGGALAQRAGGFRPAFFDIFTEFAPAGLGAGDFANDDAILVNPAPVSEVLAHELAHVVQPRAGSSNKTKHDTAKNSVGNIR